MINRCIGRYKNGDVDSKMEEPSTRGMDAYSF